MVGSRSAQATTERDVSGCGRSPTFWRRSPEKPTRSDGSGVRRPTPMSACSSTSGRQGPPSPEPSTTGLRVPSTSRPRRGRSTPRSSSLPSSPSSGRFGSDLRPPVVSSWVAHFRRPRRGPSLTMEVARQVLSSTCATAVNDGRMPSNSWGSSPAAGSNPRHANPRNRMRSSGLLRTSVLGIGAGVAACLRWLTARRGVRASLAERGLPRRTVHRRADDGGRRPHPTGQPLKTKNSRRRARRSRCSSRKRLLGTGALRGRAVGVRVHDRPRRTRSGQDELEVGRGYLRFQAAD